MTLLALAAVLLLALVPTVGRLLSSADGASGVWAQMCTVAGLKLVKLAPGDAAPTTDPAPGGSGDPVKLDCAYCLLANSIVVLLLWIVFALPARVARVHSPPRTPIPCARWHPCGLGSRGPPPAVRIAL